MWKVMIVDDEKLICKLVQALVEWDKTGNADGGTGRKCHTGTGYAAAI